MRKIMLFLLGLWLLASCGGGAEPLSEDDGMQRTYWDNGRLKTECRYVDGKLDGPYKTWYESGQVFQDGLYAEGMMDGSWLIFYPDGSLAARAQYEKGSGKQTCYNNEGCIIMEVDYVDNLKHGREIHYATNGSVLQVVNYERGKKVEENKNP